MWNTVLFDLDGTLTDSGEGITKSVQYALKKGFGIDADLRDLRSFVGPPLKEQFMSYAHLTDEEGELAVRLYRERYEKTGIYENHLYPGIKTLLAQLKREHFQIALSSSKPRQYCVQILKYFGIFQYFDVVEGAEMDGRRTDKAEVVREVIRRLHMENEKDRIVLVGDRSYDVIGAKQEGISSIGVTYGYGSRQELEAVWPDCIVDTTEELRNVLIGQKRDGERAQRIGTGYGGTVPENRKMPVRRYPYDHSTGFMIWKVIWPALLAYAVNIALALVFEIAVAIAGGISSTTELTNIAEKYSLPLTGVMDAILFIVMIQIWHRDELQRRAWNASDRLLRKKKFGIPEGIMCVCAVLTVEFVVSIFSSLIPESDEYSQFIGSFTKFPAWVSFLLIGALGPMAEELLFRGVMYRRLRDFTNIWVAAILSGITFGAFHGNLEQGVPAAVIGIAMALLYEHYGTIAASIVAHMGVNCFSLIQSLVSEKFPDSSSAVGTAVILIIAAGVFSFYYIFKREKKINRI